MDNKNTIRIAFPLLPLLPTRLDIDQAPFLPSKKNFLHFIKKGKPPKGVRDRCAPPQHTPVPRLYSVKRLYTILLLHIITINAFANNIIH